MSNIAEAIANFSLQTLKSSYDLSERDWDHPYANQNMVSEDKGEEEVFKRRLRAMNMSENDCSAELKEQMLQELKDNAQSLLSLGMLFTMALVSRDTAIISDDQIIRSLSWGPYTEHYFDQTTRYSMREEIDALGGLEAYAKQNLLRGVRKGLNSTVKDANVYDQHMKQLMSICFSGNDTMDTKLLHWFINCAEERDVAVIDNASIHYSHYGHFFIKGDHYQHPLLGTDKAQQHLSAANREAMQTTALVAYWPELRLARTISRFYLFPNGAHVPDHLAPLVTAMDNRQVLDTLRDYELNLPKLKGQEERDFRKSLTDQVNEGIARVLAPNNGTDA